jgi:rubredoxin
VPRIWFKTESFAGQTLHADLPAGTGYVELPDNFYLLASFKMKGWAKAVYETYVENDRTASIQSSEYTRGSTIQPVCTLSNRRIQTGTAFEIKQILNYYSLPKKLPEHETEEALYVPAATPIKDLDDDAELRECKRPGHGAARLPFGKHRIYHTSEIRYFKSA